MIEATERSVHYDLRLSASSGGGTCPLGRKYLRQKRAEHGREGHQVWYEIFAKAATQSERPKISEIFDVLSSQMKQKHEDLEAVFETESCKTSIELLMGLTEENQAHGKLTRTFGNKWLMIEVRNKPEKKQVIYAETERGERQAGHMAFNLDFWKRQPTIRRKISSDHE